MSEDIKYCNLCGKEFPFNKLIQAKTYVLNPKFFDEMYLCLDDYEQVKKDGLLYTEIKKDETLNSQINWICFKQKKLKIIEFSLKLYNKSLEITEILKRNKDPKSFLEIKDEINDSSEEPIMYASVIFLIKKLYEFGIVFKGRLHKTIYIKLNPLFQPFYIRKTMKKAKHKSKKQIKKSKLFNQKQLILFPKLKHLQEQPRKYIYQKISYKPNQKSFEQLSFL